MLDTLACLLSPYYINYKSNTGWRYQRMLWK